MTFEHFKEVTTLPIIGMGIEFSCTVRESASIRVNNELMPDVSESEIRQSLEMHLTNKLKKDLLKTKDFSEIKLSAKEVDILVEALHNQKMLSEQSMLNRPNFENRERINDVNSLFDRFAEMDLSFKRKQHEL